MPNFDSMPSVCINLWVQKALVGTIYSMIVDGLVEKMLIKIGFVPQLVKKTCKMGLQFYVMRYKIMK